MNPFCHVSPAAWTAVHRDLASYVVEYGFRGPVAVAAALFLLLLLVGTVRARPGDWLERLGGRLGREGTAVRVVVGLAAAGALASWLVTWTFLGALPHMLDDTGHVFQARLFLEGRLFAPLAPEPLREALRNEFLVEHDGRWFARSAPLWPAVMAAFWGLGARALANPVLNALGVVVVFALLRRAFGPAHAVWSAGLLALSPFVLVMGATLMGHPLSFLLAALALAGADRWLRDQDARGLALLSLAAGLLALERPYAGALLCMPLGVLCLQRLRAASGPGLVRGLLLLTVPAALCLCVLAWYDDALTGSPLVMPRSLSSPYDRPGFGPDLGPPGAPMGHNLSRGLANLGLQLLVLGDDLYGWPGLCLLPALVGLLLPPPGRRHDPLVRAARWSVPTLFLGLVCYHGQGSVAYGARHAYEALPCLAVLAVVGAERLTLASPDGARAVAAVALALTLVGLPTYLPQRLAYLPAYGGIAADARALAESPGLRGCVVLLPKGDLLIDLYYSFCSFNDPLLRETPLFVRALPSLTPDVLARLLPGRRPLPLRFNRQGEPARPPE